METRVVAEMTLEFALAAPISSFEQCLLHYTYNNRYDILNFRHSTRQKLVE